MGPPWPSDSRFRPETLVFSVHTNVTRTPPVTWESHPCLLLYPFCLPFIFSIFPFLLRSLRIWTSFVYDVWPISRKKTLKLEILRGYIRNCRGKNDFYWTLYFVHWVSMGQSSTTSSKFRGQPEWDVETINGQGVPWSVYRPSPWSSGTLTGCRH